MRSMLVFALLFGAVTAAGAQEPVTLPADSSALFAADSAAADGDVSFSARAPAVAVVVDRFRLVGDAASLESIPGSAQVIGPAELAARPLLFDDVHRILSRAPGLNVQEEDGYGLRPNIGMRGTGSERSARITLLEDGILISPAPYAAPAAYYFPVVGRMESIEVRKGSSQIKYGPRTTGGALNLVSSSIPEAFSWAVDLAGGGDETGKARIKAGDSYARGGWVAETYQLRTDGFKRLDGGGDTGFDVQDYLVKLRINTDAAGAVYQALELKLGRYDETSRESYLGLTEADFRRDAERRYAGSQADLMQADQTQLQLRHTLHLGERIDLTTALYRHDVARNWYKLASVGGIGIEAIANDPSAHPAELGIIQGGESAPDALSVVAGQRAYDARGVQSILGVRLGGPLLAHDVELGVRYHEDAEDRFQHADGYAMEAGRMRLTSAGAPGGNANRVSEASAWAFFAQDQIRLRRWTLTPGLRYERIAFTRTDYAGDDPHRAAPARVQTNDVVVWIPGLGVGLALSESASVFTGIHRGFAPPGPGADRDTDAEASVNIEAGGRFRRGAWGAQAAAFHNAYSNILGRATLAGGDPIGSGELFNGGAARVRGLELAIDGDPAAALGFGGAIPLHLAYTWTRARFTSSFASAFEPWGTVVSGDELPYVAPHQLFVSAGLERGPWTGQITASRIGAMRTHAGRGPIAPGDGTDAHTVWGATASFSLTPWSALFAGVENLTGERYVVARQPAGARPGLPRTLMAGLRLGH